MAAPAAWSDRWLQISHGAGGCPLIWLPLNGRGIDSATAGLLSAGKGVRAWTGRLARRLSSTR
eukprot:348957-Alexandrium_andersonii.AAC.1